MPSRAFRLFLAFAAVSVATRWLSLLIDVVDLDETCHILGARVLASGGLLYTNFVDNKPPLLYAYYAFADAWGAHRLFDVHVVTVLLVVPGTALALSAFYEHSRTGIVAALTFLVFSAAFIGHDMLAANAEIVMILPASWAVVLLAREPAPLAVRRWLAAGVLFGVAMLVKPQIATWALAPIVATWLGPSRPIAWARRLIEAAALATGSLAVATAVYVWFLWRGGAAALVYWVVWHNLWYAENPIRPGEALRRLAEFFLPFMLVTAPLWYAANRGPVDVVSTHRRRLARWLVILSLPPTWLGFRFYPHYFIQLYVPLALASAPWLEAALRRPWSRGGRVVAAWAAGALALFTIANVLLYFGPFHVHHERDPIYRMLADRLRADPCAPGPVFVWGWAPNIYYYAGLPPASRFVVLPQSQLTGYEPGNLESNRGEADEGAVVPQHWDWLMADLATSHPTFIVDLAPPNLYRWGRYPMRRYPRLQQFVSDNFVLAEDIRGARIYRARQCTTGRRLAR